MKNLVELIPISDFFSIDKLGPFPSSNPLNKYNLLNKCSNYLSISTFFYNAAIINSYFAINILINIQNMTYLIDCYESITSQLSSLNISSRKPSDSIIPENNQSKPPGKYSAIMQKTIMKHYCEAIYHEEYGWEFFSIWDNFSIEGYEVFCRVCFDELGGAMCLRFGLLKNGLPISVKSVYSISNAANYFLNINSQFDIGGFKINPINGEIFFSIINSFLPS